MDVKEPQNVYELSVDPAQPECLRNFLAFWLGPARTRMALRSQLDRATPILFATYKEQRVKCLFASRLNDVAITYELGEGGEVAERIHPVHLTDFNTTP